MYIAIFDGITTQTRKIKQDISISKAKMMLKNLRDTDYLGLEYWLEDDQGNEIEED